MIKSNRKDPDLLNKSPVIKKNSQPNDKIKNR